MILASLPIRKFLIAIVSGTSLTISAIIIVLYLLTNDLSVIFYGFLFTIALFTWGAIFLKHFQKKLCMFADNLCETLDCMIDDNNRPVFSHEEETLLARISNRLERLYNIMKQNRIKVEEEKTELQSLVSDISHQTKTPIANLKIINDTLLTHSMSDEKRKEFLSTTQTQLNKLDFLIQAMVKASRLETGVITLKKQDSLIFDTLVSAVNSILSSMEKKQINLSVNCPENLIVAHDSRWTAEALFNILDNAVKYTPIGGSINISVSEWEMYVKIDVSDTGYGIPENLHATIFKRFYRDESVHNTYGVGIGLYLSREIITMQGGYIKVDSAVGKGSTFSTFMPRR